ncbi:MAG: hypothetical protein Q9221_008830 [Calogaya cf. arnoldii]
MADMKRQLTDELTAKVEAELGGKFRSDLAASIEAELRPQIEAKLREELQGEVENQLRAALKKPEVTAMILEAVLHVRQEEKEKEEKEKEKKEEAEAKAEDEKEGEKKSGEVALAAVPGDENDAMLAPGRHRGSSTWVNSDPGPSQDGSSGDELPLQTEVDASGERYPRYMQLLWTAVEPPTG